MKNKFNPKDWLPKNEGEEQQPSNNVPSPQPSSHSSIQPSDISDDIELVVSRIESAHIDITGSYADWLNLGFALTNEMGERGRDYYHRICRFYSNYSHQDCNKQYDQCLKSTGHGITIKTLFHMAKQAGIEVHGAWGMEHGASGSKFQVSSSRPTGSEASASGSEPQAPGSMLHEQVELPTFPDSIFETLPEILKKVVSIYKTREVRDIMLLGSLVSFSSCLPKVYGIYDDKRVSPNLFLFVTAPASAGKGNLVLCRRLVNPIHWELRQLGRQMKQAYEIEMREYNLQKAKDFTLEKPIKPPEKMLFIPANNSTTGVFQLLADNEGKGLIFETEGDTLAQAFKSDYGNYSDGFRKAFQNENISYYRRTDREYVEIEEPCLSAVLSSTPKQVASLIPNAENGLFSRFAFYHMNLRAVWKDVLAESVEDGLNAYFNALGQEFLPLYKALSENPEIKFCVTDEQRLQFNEFFTQLQDKYMMLKGLDYIATIRRLGLIAFRIAMVFTSLRILETGDFSPKQICRDDDFQAAISMVKVLVKHASYVHSQLPEDARPIKPKDKKEQFLDLLPEKFSYKEFVDLAKTLSITARTAEKYIAKFCEKGLIVREQQGVYTNLNFTKGEQ